MKIKLKDKHWELGHHYCRFIDKRWYSNYILDEKSLEIFIRVETYGKSSISNEEFILAEPLFNGKQLYELTLKMRFEELADWWAMGWGWYWPIFEDIKSLFAEKNRDKIYIRALIKIVKSCKKNGFLETLLNYTGMSQEDKNRHISIWLARNSK